MDNYVGFDALGTGTSEWNAIDFAVRRILSEVNTAALVRVEAVRGATDSLDAPGFVDIKPLVAQLDGKGQAVPHGTIYNVPFVRIQGGSDAVVIDPKAGDLGVAIFCGRDISSVKQTKSPGNPGSLRRFDWADAVYLGGLLNGVPTQYIRFSSEGVEIVSPSTVTIRAPQIVADGDVMVTGSVAAGGDVTGMGKSLATHTHGGVTTGGGTSGPPS